MKKHLLTTLIALLFPFVSQAASVLEGTWNTEDGSKQIRINEFNGSVTLSTSTYYNTGALVTWFFDYRLPQGRDVQVGETISGRVRSVDGYYSCVFDEKAEAKLEAPGVFKVRFPLLTYHRETRSVRDSNGGYYHQRTIDWNGWGWVETNYGFPIERYRVISSECVVDQRNWITATLTQTNSPFPPAPFQP